MNKYNVLLSDEIINRIVKITADTKTQAYDIIKSYKMNHLKVIGIIKRV